LIKTLTEIICLKLDKYLRSHDKIFIFEGLRSKQTKK